MYEQPNDHTKEIIAFIAVLVVVVVIVGAVALGSKKKDSVSTGSTATNTSVATTTPTTTPTTTSGSYKDGSYTATGSYDSPDGMEQIGITVTLKDGVVTDTSATAGAHDRDGQMYQSMFIADYKQYVVGKKVDEISLGRVSGASLTTQGFNDALAQIRNKAQS